MSDGAPTDSDRAMMMAALVQHEYEQLAAVLVGPQQDYDCEQVLKRAKWIMSELNKLHTYICAMARNVKDQRFKELVEPVAERLVMILVPTQSCIHVKS